MRAMVLAAGLGTRLRPLTNDRPKALVTIAGRTLLEITLQRLRGFGVQDVIINVHHFADAVIAHLKENNAFGMNVAISHENVLLNTGGGLKKAASFFLDSSNSEKPFLMHNVDVISTIDLVKMLHSHTQSHALATLATQHRETSRKLLFDDDRQLCGRRTRNDPPEMVREAATTDAVGFCGVHVISPRLLREMTETNSFSIIETYLRLASCGERVSSFSADEYYWRDLGRPESIAAAEVDFSKGLFA
jgi:NDP-sugar pyrophosphorylase family protein